MSLCTNTDKNEPPTILYHYTTVKGLTGILEDKKIWATNINHLNDSEEYNGSLSKLTKQIKSLTILPNYAFLYDDVLELLKEYSHHIYVCSFSEKKDDLSQWRAYSSYGNGFSIGFNRLKLDKLKQVTLGKCIYKPEEQDAKIKSTIDKLKSVVINNEGQDNPGRIINDIMEKFVMCAPYNKHNAFGEESEWRIVTYVHDEQIIKFRLGKAFLLIPYCELGFQDGNGKSPIDEIWIGPKPNMSEWKLSLEILKRKYGIREIYESKIPYRELG